MERFGKGEKKVKREGEQRRGGQNVFQGVVLLLSALACDGIGMTTPAFARRPPSVHPSSSMGAHCATMGSFGQRRM